MPQTYLLLASQQHEKAEAILVNLVRARISRSGEGVSVFFEPSKKGGLFDCAVRAGLISWQILSGEKKLRHNWRLTYAMPGIQAEGRSAELAFALQQIAQAYADDPAVPAVPAFAATGTLGDEGQVGGVESFPAKVHAAIEMLRDQPGACIFIPSANAKELPADWLGEDRHPRVVPVSHIREALETLGIDLQWSYLGCPFRGLEHFGFEHRGIFFGREAALDDCLAQLDQRAAAKQPGLLVMGPSGSGKSSFVQAGLLAGLLAPSLERQRTSWPRHLKDNLWRPSVAGKNPDEVTLVRSLLEGWAKVIPDLGEKLPERLDDVAEFLIQRLPTGQPMLWVIDQLEELFTHDYDPTLIAGFGNLLTSLQQAQVWVLATLRDDYLPPLLQVESLRKWYDPVRYYLPPLSEKEGLSAAITRPAVMAGLAFEVNAKGYSLDQQLRDEALNEADPMPLVEYALFQLYQQRKDTLLTWESYKKMGGLVGVIGQQAEIAFNTFPLTPLPKNAAEAQSRRQTALRRLLRALVNSGSDGEKRTARVVPFGRFEQDQDVRDLIKALDAKRLLVMLEVNKVLMVRVAHEALLSKWSTANALLEQDKEDLKRRDRLEAAQKLWQDAEERHSQALLLAPGLPLGEATELCERWGADLEPSIHEYVRRSSRKAKRRRYVVGATIVALTILTLITTTQWHRQKVATDDAERQRAKVLAIRSLEKLADGDPLLARDLATESTSAWRDDNGQPDPEAAYAMARSTLVTEVFVTPDARLRLLADVIGPTEGVWDTKGFVFETSGKRAAVLSQDLKTLVALTPEGGPALAAAFSQSGSVFLLNQSGGIEEFNPKDRNVVWRHSLQIAGKRISPHYSECKLETCVALYSTPNGAFIFLLRLKDRKVIARKIELNELGKQISPPVVRVFGQYLAVTGSGNRPSPLLLYRINDVDGKEQLRSKALLPIHVIEQVIDFEFMKEGKLVVVRQPNLIELIEIDPYRTTYLGQLSAEVSRLAVNADAEVATAICIDGSLAVVDRESLYHLPVRKAPIHRAYSIRDLSYVLLLGEDGMAELVDYMTSKTVLQWRATPSWVRASTYQSMTDRLLVLSEDGNLHAWQLNFAQQSRMPHEIKVKSDLKTKPPASSRSGHESLLIRQIEWKTVPTAGFSTRDIVDPVFVDGSRGLAVLNTDNGIWILQKGKVSRLAEAPEYAIGAKQFRTDFLVILSQKNAYLIANQRFSGGISEVALLEARKVGAQSIDEFSDIVLSRDGEIIVIGDRAVHIVDPELRTVKVAANLAQDLTAFNKFEQFWSDATTDTFTIVTNDCVIVRIHTESGRIISAFRQRCK